ncbi:MAG TPA: aminoglycoside phosphotransferase family protein [Candidatus Binataceae bacterium]|nr:aminoglycoside phosphotransferase family protein [Candidatus Binataceae bacterium]
MIDAAAAVAAINRNHGTRYRLAGAMPGGESGAVHRITDESGAEYILKWGEGAEFHADRTVTIVRRLRAVGYPVPEIVLASRDDELPRYLIQRIMPGTRPSVLSRRMVERVIELNKLQEDGAAEFAENWPASIVESIERGYRDWCVHKSLMNYSAETADFLVELKKTAKDARGLPFRQRDAVHFDFSNANMLVEEDAITGIIDWNGCRAGDRGFDLVTLGFYALADPATSKSILDHAVRVSGSVAVALYLAHMVLRQMDWSIRHHDEATIQRYLSIARSAMAIIRELAPRDTMPS